MATTRGSPTASTCSTAPIARRRAGGGRSSRPPVTNMTPSPSSDGARLLALALRALAVGYLLAISAAVVAYKAAFLRVVAVDPFFAVYGVVVCGYILSRFAISLRYRPTGYRGIEPTVAIVMPAFNEEEAIAQSIRSLLRASYPHDKLEIVVVDD